MCRVTVGTFSQAGLSALLLATVFSDFLHSACSVESPLTVNALAFEVVAGPVVVVDPTSDEHCHEWHLLDVVIKLWVAHGSFSFPKQCADRHLTERHRAGLELG
jgi:hypothetical protein